MGYCPWGHKESDKTEQLTLSLHSFFFFLIFIEALQGPPVVKQFVQMVTMVPGQGRLFQSVPAVWEAVGPFPTLSWPSPAFVLSVAQWAW